MCRSRLPCKVILKSYTNKETCSPSIKPWWSMNVINLGILMIHLNCSLSTVDWSFGKWLTIKDSVNYMQFNKYFISYETTFAVALCSHSFQCCQYSHHYLYPDEHLTWTVNSSYIHANDSLLSTLTLWVATLYLNWESGLQLFTVASSRRALLLFVSF